MGAIVTAAVIGGTIGLIASGGDLGGALKGAALGALGGWAGGALAGAGGAAVGEGVSAASDIAGGLGSAFTSTNPSFLGSVMTNMGSGAAEIIPQAMGGLSAAAPATFMESVATPFNAVGSAIKEGMASPVGKALNTAKNVYGVANLANNLINPPTPLQQATPEQGNQALIGNTNRGPMTASFGNANFNAYRG